MKIEAALGSVYRIDARLEFDIDDRRIVTVRRRQNHWIQRLARKLGLRIPAWRNIALDDYASFVFLQIDGQRTVAEIGENLLAHYGEAAQPLYPRLMMFLQHIERSEHFIAMVGAKQA